MGASETLASRLADRCGIAFPAARVQSLGESPYSTFLVRHFDRSEQGGRFVLVSALTLTRKRDGEEGGSYLDLVDLLQRQGANTLADTHQRYRRIAFSVLLHNTDDHLRNHGFFAGRDRVRLSPTYDLNPSVDRDEPTLSIDETRSLCNYYRGPRRSRKPKDIGHSSGLKAGSR